MTEAARRLGGRCETRGEAKRWQEADGSFREHNLCWWAWPESPLASATKFGKPPEPEATIGGFCYLKQMLSLDSRVDFSWISGSKGGLPLGQWFHK